MKHIYVITDLDFCKIGIARDPKERLGDLQVGNPIELKLIYYTPIHDDKQAFYLESRIHRKLKYLKMSGEWFDIQPSAAILAIQKIILGKDKEKPSENLLDTLIINCPRCKHYTEIHRSQFYPEKHYRCIICQFRAQGTKLITHTNLVLANAIQST